MTSMIRGMQREDAKTRRKTGHFPVSNPPRLRAFAFTSPMTSLCRNVALILAFALAGCAAPKQFKAPDPGRLIAAQKALQESVALAHAKVRSGAGHVEAASAHLAAATVSHSKESVLLGEIGPRLLALRASITDAVLREQVDALSADVTQARDLASATDTELAAIGREHVAAKDDLGEANVTMVKADWQAGEINTKYGPELFKAMEKTVADANLVILTERARGDRNGRLVWMWFSAFALTAVGFAAFAYFKR